MEDAAICLSFDVSGSKGKFGRVQYVGERFPSPESPDQAFMWKLLSTRSEAWKSEKRKGCFFGLKSVFGIKVQVECCTSQISGLS
jgi:hypothetical protein